MMDRHHKITAHGNEIPVRSAHHRGGIELDNPVRGCLDEGLLSHLSRSADVEGPHRQLRTGLTDGLRRNDTHRFAHIDACPACQITTITGGTGPEFGFAGQDRTDLDRLNAGIVDCFDNIFIDIGIGRHNHLRGSDILDVFGQGPAQHTCPK